MGYLVCIHDTATIVEELDADDFLRAASFMAGAGDKKGRIDVDILIYLNNRLGVNTLDWGSSDPPGIRYCNFEGASYKRGDTHSSTTAALLQPPDDATPDSYPTSFDVVEKVSIYDKDNIDNNKIFSDDWPESVKNNLVDKDTPIIRFVRAADDALAIIRYLHNFELPDYPLPPVTELHYPLAE